MTRLISRTIQRLVEAGGPAFRQHIFVIITQHGGFDILIHIHERVDVRKRLREHTSIHEFSDLLVYHSDISVRGMEIKFPLVDEYVPFLPLKPEHVRECTRGYLKRKNVPKYLIE